MSKRPRVAHVTTVDLTLRFLLSAQLRRLVADGLEVDAISAPGPWTEEIEQFGVRFVPWPSATRSWRPIKDLRAFVELVGILRRGHYSAVHTHNPKPGVLGRIAARLAGVPVVINTVHGLYATPEDRWSKRIAVLGMERIAGRFSHLELYQSEEDLAWARSLKIVSEPKSVLLGNGVDLSHFDPSASTAGQIARLRKELDIDDGAIVVGAVGRLVAEKGYRELFATAHKVKATIPGVVFLIIGDVDPEKTDSITAEERSAVSDSIKFVGWRTDVRDLLELMDIFVLASHREGLPRSAIEAAAMGKALVLTDIRGCREVARHRREGLLVPPHDADALTAAVLELVQSKELRKELGTAARSRALERFDERRVADTVSRCTTELLDRAGLIFREEGGVTVRHGRRSDAARLARLHAQGLPDGFLPKLGPRFLALLYRALIRDPAASVVVAQDGGEVVGFAAVVKSVHAFYRRFFIRYGWLAGLVALPRLLRPSVLSRARETASYRPDGQSGDAELLAISVEGAAQRKGAGRTLAYAVLDDLREMGVGRVRVVVAQSNQRANRFYEKIGFEFAQSIEVHSDTPSNLWIYSWHS